MTTMTFKKTMNVFLGKEMSTLMVLKMSIFCIGCTFTHRYLNLGSCLDIYAMYTWKVTATSSSSLTSIFQLIVMTF